MRWTSNFELEAELHDSHSLDGSGVFTELASTARHAHDFVDCVTFVRVAKGNALNFSVSPRPVSVDGNGVAHKVTTRRYRLRTRARAHMAGAHLLLFDTAQMAMELSRVRHHHVDWAWEAALDQSDFILRTNKEYTLTLRAINSSVDIDALELVEQ